MSIHHLKKWFSALLALMMILACAAASANTVRIRMSVDPQAAEEAITIPNAQADQAAIIKAVVSLVNAAEIRLVTAADGIQADLDLNGENTFSLGYVLDGQGIRLVSTLFPNYVLTL